MKKIDLLSPVFPANDRVYLKPVTVQGIEIDVCPRSGGIWFDRFELNKFDEAHEDLTELLAAIPKEVEAPRVTSQLRSPRHPEAVMMRQPFGPKGMNGALTVDICPMCAGVWFDHKEILKVRELYPTAEEKQKLSQAFVDDAFSKVAKKPAKVPEPKKVQSMFGLLGSIRK